jgi:hypothetical protein
MEAQPYTIYANSRPVRIAFLVNPDRDLVWLDRIIEFNREKWGGRFNPIIPTDGNMIDNLWWKFLRDFDPDIVFPCVALDLDLQRKIQSFVCPFYLESAPPEDGPIRIQEDPISIIPSKQTISSVSGGFVHDEDTLALFEIDESTPNNVREFLNRNFGVLGVGYSRSYYISHSLQSCKTKTYRVTDLQSLNQALLEIIAPHERFVFLAQICAVPNSLIDVKHNYDQECFAVIVGDTTKDLMYSWNRTIGFPKWMRTQLTHLWLPPDLASEGAIQEGLGRFINRWSERTGDGSNRPVHFVSFSVAEERLKAISSEYSAVLRNGIRVIEYSESQVPDFEERPPFPHQSERTELFRGYSRKERIELSDPKIESAGVGGQHWIVDLSIEHRSEGTTSLTNRGFWWQFPKRNGSVHLRMFSNTSRINRHGMFSVLMRRRSSHDLNAGVLEVNLPTDQDVFSALVWGDGKPSEVDGTWSRVSYSPDFMIKPSNEGMILSGILRLFPDLDAVHSYLRNRFWRNTLKTMANAGAAKDNDKLQAIKNTLAKEMAAGQTFSDSSRDLEQLAEVVLKYAKNYASRDVDITFEEFKKKGITETDEYNRNNPGNPIDFGGRGLKDDISCLLDWNVF